MLLPDHTFPGEQEWQAYPCQGENQGQETARKASAAPGAPTRSELEGKAVAELRALCTAAKLPTTGGKEAVVHRLLVHHGAVELDSLSSAGSSSGRSRSSSPVLGSSERASTGRLKDGPDGSVNLTPALLRDQGFIDTKLCALLERCDEPLCCRHSRGHHHFSRGDRQHRLGSPGAEVLTSRRVTRMPIALPRIGCGGGSTLVDGGILGSYAVGSPDRPAVVNLLYDARLHVEVKGPGLPVEVKWALFAETFDDLLDQCVVDVVPTELLSTVLGRSPAKNGGPENPSRDSETKEKDYQGSQAQYMARLKKVWSEMYVNMTKVDTAKIYSLLVKGVGGDYPAKVYIPQDPACALEVMRSLHCPTTGNRNTDSIGEGLLVEAGKTSRAEMTQSQVADMRKSSRGELGRVEAQGQRAR